MDKTSEVSSIHSETGLTNNQPNQQKTNETCCEVSCQTGQNHIPAAVSNSNSEKEDLGDLNLEYGFMAGAKDAKEKPDKQILILSMGLKTQETTEMWQSRSQGGFRKEPYFIDSAVKSHCEQGRYVQVTRWLEMR